MTLKPIGGQVLIRVLPKTKGGMDGGIYIPDSVAQPEGPLEGVIEALGGGGRDERGRRVPFNVKVGDKVLFARHGTVVKTGDDESILTTEEAIYGIIT